MNKYPHPFIKWAGGKKSIINHIMKRIPSKIETYFEPMVGGGYVLFYLSKVNAFEKAVISDTNEELITTYNVIKNDVSSLMNELSNGDYICNKDCFLEIRRNTDISDPIKKAARFIYLNKTCFNGLYRVNKSGNFNVPYGKHENPKIYDEENLIEVSKVLKNVTILNTDFENAVSSAKEGDTVYFDPPYIPISKTANFTGYTSSGFGLADHEKLRNVFTQLSLNNVRVLLSNSASEESIDLYSKFDIDTITGIRSISGFLDCRKSMKEILVYAGPKNTKVGVT